MEFEELKRVRILHQATFVYLIIWFLVQLEFAICTSPIIHLVCPPKFCISIVFNFSWDGWNHLVACSRLKGSRKSGTREKSRAKTAFGLGSCWEVVLTGSLAKASLLVTQKGLGERRGRQDDCVALGKRERVVSRLSRNQLAYLLPVCTNM